MIRKYWSFVDINTILGLTFTSVREGGGDSLLMSADDGQEFSIHHESDCCESVELDDVCGDLSDLMGSPITLSEIVTNSDDPPRPSDYEPDSYTWTFIKLGTNKGSVTLRFFGESNGYYSETADLYQQLERSY